MGHAKAGPFTNGAAPALNAGTLGILDSQYDDAMADVAAAGYTPKWQPSTSYTAGQSVLAPTGELVQATTTHTSGSAFSGIGVGGNWSYRATAKTPQSFGRGTNARAYRTWDAHISGAFATPRVYIVGHSVVAGTNASTSATQFANIIGSTLAAINPSITTTVSGHSGLTSGQILAAETTPSTKQSLVIMMAMLNDYSTNVPSATTKTNLQALIALYRASPQPAPGPSIVIIGEWLRSDVSSRAEPWQNYLNVAQQVADADDDVAFIDMSQPLGAVLADPADLNLFAGDNVHPNDNGHAIIAQQVLREVMRGRINSGTVLQFPWQTQIDCTVLETYGVTAAPMLTTTGGVLGWVRETDGTVASWMQWTVPLAAGTYTMAIYHRLGSDRGRYWVYIDGVKQGTTPKADGYAATAADSRDQVAGFSITATGVHTIKIQADDKNASSSSYKLSVSKIAFQRTA